MFCFAFLSPLPLNFIPFELNAPSLAAFGALCATILRIKIIPSRIRVVRYNTRPLIMHIITQFSALSNSRLRRFYLPSSEGEGHCTFVMRLPFRHRCGISFHLCYYTLYLLADLSRLARHRPLTILGFEPRPPIPIRTFDRFGGRMFRGFFLRVRRHAFSSNVWWRALLCRIADRWIGGFVVPLTPCTHAWFADSSYVVSHYYFLPRLSRLNAHLLMH